MPPMKARERLYLTSGRDQLVRQGDPLAAFLYAGEGDEIPETAAERFGLVDGRLPTRRKSSAAETLLGSSVLPAMVELAAGVTIQLGLVVARAHKDSGLSVDAWNALPEADREAKLAQAVDTMKTEPPPSPKAPKPKARAGKEQKPAGDKELKPAGNKGGQGAQPPKS